MRIYLLWFESAALEGKHWKILTHCLHLAFELRQDLGFQMSFSLFLRLKGFWHGKFQNWLFFLRGVQPLIHKNPVLASFRTLTDSCLENHAIGCWLLPHDIIRRGDGFEVKKNALDWWLCKKQRELGEGLMASERFLISDQTLELGAVRSTASQSIEISELRPSRVRRIRAANRKIYIGASLILIST